MNSAVEVLGRILIFGGAGVLSGALVAALVRGRKGRLVAAAIAIITATAVASVLAVTGDRDSMGSLARAAVTAVVALNAVGFVLVLGAASLLGRASRSTSGDAVG